jgi:two-component system sensor histidine kinase ChiS
MAVKILVVDDEPTIEALMQQQFQNQVRQKNLAFIFVRSGREALEHLKANTEIDVMLCDVSTPGVDGLGFLTHLAALNPVLKTIIISACSDMNTIRAAMNSGAFDFISKPIDFQDLENTIKRALRHALQHREAQSIIEHHRDHIEQIARASARFVPQEFLRVLEKGSILDVKLGDQIQREMTIMFCDIRDFTRLSERMSPQENFNFINSYLSRVSPIIREHNGFIDKYMGDGIMALFPGEAFPGQADDAIDAAIAMQREVVIYNRHRASCGYRPIQIGIGLHTGSVMLGTVGEEERMEGTVISDTVNLASRIERLTRMYGAAIIVSDRILFSLDRRLPYNFRFLDRVRVKGKDKAVSVFEVLDSSMPNQRDGKLATQDNFEKGLFHYHRGDFRRASRYFRRVVTADPNDSAAQLYLQRTNHYAQYGVPVGWEGIEILTEK